MARGHCDAVEFVAVTLLPLFKSLPVKCLALILTFLVCNQLTEEGRAGCYELLANPLSAL